MRIALWNADARSLEELNNIALAINLEKYRKQLGDVPVEKIAPVPSEVGVPIMEKLSYVTDEELSVLTAV